MKSIRTKYPTLYSFENLYRSFHQASIGRNDKPYVIEFRQQLEENLLTLQEELISNTYTPGDYHTFWITDPKTRLISAAPFRDRIVHHALINILEPYLERQFIEDTYACRKGKGTIAAIERAHFYLKRYRYVFKADIRKFFPSIDLQILKGKLRRIIQDEDIYRLVCLIIENSNKQEDVLMWFAGDDLLTPATRRKGLPIGNLTSQFFANFFLSSMDRMIKQELNIKGYVRYMDDFLLFDGDRDYLQYTRNHIIENLSKLRLKLHPRKQEIVPCKNGVPFLGFHLNLKGRRILRRNIRTFRKRMGIYNRKIQNREMTYFELTQCLVSWVGFVGHGDTWNLRKRLFLTYLVFIFGMVEFRLRASV